MNPIRSLIVALLTVVLVSPTALSQTAGQIHVSLGATPEDEEMQPADISSLVLQWSSVIPYGPHDLPVARYTIDGGSQATVAAMLTGQTRDYTPVGEGVHVDYHYSAVIEASRGDLVTYSVGSPGAGFSEERTVNMTPDFVGNIRFAALSNVGYSGYSRVDGMRVDGEEAPQETTIKAILDVTPDLVISPGGLGMSSSSMPWKAFQDAIEPLASTVPFMPVPSALDSEQDYHQFRERWVLPGHDGGVVSGSTLRADDQESFYYGFSAGHVYFLGLNSASLCEGPESPGIPPCATGVPNGAQYQWLHDTLEDAREDFQARWIVVYFYDSPYAFTDDGGYPAVGQLWVPFLDAFSVDLVITGGEYTYERSYPMRSGVPLTSQRDQYTSGIGPIYVTTGAAAGAAAPMDQPWPPWLAAQNATQSFLMVDADWDRMHIQSIASESGAVMDEFTITHHKSNATADGQALDVEQGGDSPSIGSLTGLAALGAAMVLSRRRGTRRR